MSRKVLSVVLLLTTILTTTCKDPFNPKLSEYQIDVLVVEGDITVGSVSEIYLSKAAPLLTGASGIEYISNAVVYIEDEKSNRYNSLLSYDVSGLPFFMIDSRWFPVDKSYKLVVEYEGNIYTTELMSVLQTPEIRDIGLTVNEDKKSVSFHVSTMGGSEELKYFKWSYKEDWEFTARYYPLYMFDEGTNRIVEIDNPLLRYYCWDSGISKNILISTIENQNTTTISEHVINSINFADNRLSYLYRVELFQKSITKDEYRYLSNVKKNSDQIGGIFGPQPSEMRGNIKCISNNNKMVLGYISCSTVTKMTKYFKTIDLGVYTPPVCEMTPNIVHEDGRFTNLEMFEAGFQIYDREIDGSWIWSDKACLDCRYFSKKEKPSNWPVTHE